LKYVGQDKRRDEVVFWEGAQADDDHAPGAQKSANTRRGDRKPKKSPRRGDAAMLTLLDVRSYADAASGREGDALVLRETGPHDVVAV
jgi:hypothetical protein